MRRHGMEELIESCEKNILFILEQIKANADGIKETLHKPGPYGKTYHSCLEDLSDNMASLHESMGRKHTLEQLTGTENDYLSGKD